LCLFLIQRILCLLAEGTFKGCDKVLESLITVLAICIDSLAIGIIYGTKDIKIPKNSLMIINATCIFLFFISIFFGNILKRVLPENVASVISFLILFSLGIYYIMEGLINYCVSKVEKPKKKIEIKFSNARIVIDVALDCTSADLNRSGDIDVKEAMYLGIALSLDSLGVGFSSAMGNINYVQVLILTAILNYFALVGGLSLGKKTISKTKFNFSWVSGLMLIFLAISKLI